MSGFKTHVLVAAALVGCTSGPVRAQGPQQVEETDDFGIGPHCGLYSAFVAISALGGSPRKTLVHDETYLSSPSGSSGTDLCRAVAAEGYHAQPLSDLSAQSLLGLDGPAVLHFRTAGATEYDHWVTYLGYEHGKFKIYDPPKHVVYLTEAELLTQWDGYAVVISKDGMGVLPRSWARLPHGRLILTAALALAACTVLTRRRLQNGRWAYLWVPVVIGALTLLQLFLPGGAAWNRAEVRLSVPNAPRYKNHPEIATAAELAGFAQANPCVLVDARPDFAFRLGRLPGAENLPVGSSLTAYQAFLARHPADRTTFVVYCQTEGCRWADGVATALRTCGANRVYVYRGGFNEFESSPGSVVER
ncbi:MAG TPA: rhodanese-like domain-containing protein [Gemmata sp.]